MALWNGLGQAATLAQLGGVDASGLISMIIQAVQTVKQNKEECRQLVQDVKVISGLVQILQQLQMMRFPVIREPLDGLEDTLRQVYKLVTSCQQRNIMYSLLMDGNQAQKFRDVRDRINFHLQLYPMISHIHTTYFLSGIYSRVDPSGIQPQDLEKILESFASYPNPDSRSGINNEITMSAGRELPYAPLSGITEFTLSTLVATTQHFPKESITEGGGHSQVTMQKIVIRIYFTSDKNRSKAMALIAKAVGVSSLAITGDRRDMLEVFGHGVDPVCLASCLLRKVGHAQILQVEVKDTESQPVVMNTEEARPADKPAANGRQRVLSRGGFRAILTKVSKFMWRARRSVSPPPPSPPCVEHTDNNPALAAPGGPSSHLFSVPSTSTAVSAASPPACTQEQLAVRNPSASAQRQDLSRAADLPPVTVSPARRRRRRTFNMPSRVRLSAWPAAARRQQTAQHVPGNASSSNAGGTDDELAAAVEAGCVLKDYVAMFDGPMPQAVIVGFIAWVALSFAFLLKDFQYSEYY